MSERQNCSPERSSIKNIYDCTKHYCIRNCDIHVQVWPWPLNSRPNSHVVLIGKQESIHERRIVDKYFLNFLSNKTRHWPLRYKRDALAQYTLYLRMFFQKTSMKKMTNHGPDTTIYSKSYRDLRCTRVTFELKTWFLRVSSHHYVDTVMPTH
jgi:hypothetical protein